jgi:outer membrane protein assembly factor BamB
MDWIARITLCLLLPAAIASAGESGGTSAATAAESAWPGFLGPPSDELPADGIPLRWSPVENVAWTAALPGYGQSSPVVWGGRGFVNYV